jgi:hypothetical protein
MVGFLLFEVMLSLLQKKAINGEKRLIQYKDFIDLYEENNRSI